MFMLHIYKFITFQTSNIFKYLKGKCNSMTFINFVCIFPQPPSPMLSLTQDENDVFNATDFGPICIQPADQKIWDGVQMKNHKAEMKKRKLSKFNISEDCLTLNIYVELVNSNGPVSTKKNNIFSNY